MITATTVKLFTPCHKGDRDSGKRKPWNGTPGEFVPQRKSVADPATRHGTNSPGAPFHSLLDNAPIALMFLMYKNTVSALKTTSPDELMTGASPFLYNANGQLGHHKKGGLHYE